MYLEALDAHIHALMLGEADRAIRIEDFAKQLHVHPHHLGNTIKAFTGKSTCALYEEKLLAIARKMLADRSRTIADIARQLTYDPSNFTKFFKAYTGITPKAYRASLPGPGTQRK